jgi:hypothetical protein
VGNCVFGRRFSWNIVRCCCCCCCVCLYAGRNACESLS